MIIVKDIYDCKEIESVEMNELRGGASKSLSWYERSYEGFRSTGFSDILDPAASLTAEDTGETEAAVAVPNFLRARKRSQAT